MKNALITIIEQAQLALRETHPAGTFDNAKRWYPSEPCLFCDCIRTPSRAHPYSLMVHARSMEHVADLNDADMNDVKRIRKYLNSLSKGAYVKIFNKLDKNERKTVLEAFKDSLTDLKENNKYDISEEEANELINTINTLKI